jgi:hypothetical protein
VVEPLGPAVAAGVGLSRPVDPGPEQERERRRRAQREAYRPVRLPELPENKPLTLALDGQWLFRPLDPQDPVPAEPGIEDSDWHVLPVPGFWNVTGWWIFGQGNRHVSWSFLYEELRRCEAFTFDWREVKCGCYRHWLDLPETWAGARVRLEFDAVASVCAVFCNGQRVGGNAGMFRPFEVDLTPYLTPGGRNLLAVWVQNGDRVDAATDDATATVAVTMPVEASRLEGVPRAIYSSPLGEDNEPLIRRQGGIWQHVRLHASRRVQVRDVVARTERRSLDLEIEAEGETPPGAELVVTLTGSPDSTNPRTLTRVPWSGAGLRRYARVFTDLDVEPWSPAAPTLYRLHVALVAGKTVLDAWEGTVGFRSFESRGNRFYLNDKPFRWLGANMPPHGLAPLDRDTAREFVSRMKDGNQVGVRTVCSPFTETWLEEADRQGLAVSVEGTWSWLMIGDSAIPSDGSLETWRSEWLTLMRRLGRHPSVVMWTVNNETYLLGDPDLERRARKWRILQDLVADMRELDPTRPVVLWSGYTDRAYLPALAQIPGLDVAVQDTGDVDDRHLYCGTYSPSALGNPDWFAAVVRDQMTHERPLVSQESATPYPNTDTGHQERSYVQGWHGQAWSGNNIYEHRDPTPFLERHARLTAEQIEQVRKLSVAGWLAFCNATWYARSHVADAMRPFPAHERVRNALAPVLVAMDMPERHFFAGARLRPPVFVVNDGEEAETLTDLTVALELVLDDRGTVSRSRVPLADAPPGETVFGQGDLTLPPELPLGRTPACVELSLYAGGERVAGNRYPVVLCRREYAGLPEDWRDPGAWPEGVEVVSAAEATDWERAVASARAGRQVLVLDPQTLPDMPEFDHAALVDCPYTGECANAVADRTSPLLDGMTNPDLAWWSHADKAPRVYDRAVTFTAPIPESVECWIDHVPPHGYTRNWRVEYPLLHVPLGSGGITVCTLNLSAVDRDPLAARFLSNLLRELADPGPGQLVGAARATF